MRLLLYVIGFIATIQARSLKEDEKTPYELNEFLNGSFQTKSFNGTWMTGNSIMFKSSGENLDIYDVHTKNSTPFIGNDIFTNYKGATVIVSPDQLYILIRYNVSAVFRHSTTALYAIFDVTSKVYHDVAKKEPIQIAQWAPVDHGLAYVQHNNIFYLENPDASPKQITTNGVDGVIYNGVPDWVYEEEVLGTGLALWFSPNGQRLAFATFNDTEVQDFMYILYEDNLYPKKQDIRYPKVGTVNPTVQTFIVDLQAATTLPLVQIQALDETVDESEHVFYDLTWPTNDEVALVWTNRIQNEGNLYRCNLLGICRVEQSYKETKGWLDARIPKYNGDGTVRLEILPQPEGDDAFNHLVLTDVATKAETRLTKGEFTVTSIFGWDLVRNIIYFGGSGEKAPWQQHVYSVDSNSLTVKCLTCEWETPSGVCTYASASFSKDLSNFAKICQGPGPYFVQLEKTNEDGEKIVWEDNAQLREKLSKKLQPQQKNLKVKIQSGFDVNVRLILPPNLDESKKYPAVVNVYGGPDSNQIRDSYSAGFEKYIVTNREYIYIFIDGRGSGRDGKNKMFQIYKQMATVEIQDQIAVTKYLQDTLSYIDATRTGIWGWSYGGFATAWVLAQDTENVFKFGLSVAPVTDFVLYDSIYTERYMGLPTEEDNLAGYNNTDVTRRAKSFEGKSFFLIHGNADDNVHYQQAMLLARALELADVQFLQQSYPDENHSLGGVSRHLYHTIDRFWAKSFGLPDPLKSAKLI